LNRVPIAMSDAFPDSAPQPLRELASRRAPQWSPACWFAFMIEAIPEAFEDADADDGGSERVHHPAHFLVAVWSPVEAPPLPQLPDAAAIVAGSLAQAASEVLRLCPPGVPLVLVARDQINPIVVADMIIAGDRNLGARYRAALEDFVAAERAHWRAAIAQEYTDRDEGYERFKTRLFRAGGAA